MFKRLGLLLIPSIAAAACANGAGEPSSTESAPLSTTRVPAKVTQPANPYTLFETLQVRPLALSSDGQTLYALNTPDNRLEIFRVEGRGLQPVGSVVVGLEPVALALRNDGEVWVVNHLSDSVSIVTLDELGPRVSRTLLVGDEPRDVMAATQAGYGAKVAVATGPATIGYLRDHPQHRPDFVITSMGELIGLIDRLRLGKSAQ